MVFPSLVRTATFRINLSFIGIAQLLDVLSTRSALARGAVELNPIAATLQQSLGEAWAIPKLLLGIGAVAVAAKLPPERITPAAFWLALLFAKLYAIVILNNYLQLL